MDQERELKTKRLKIYLAPLLPIDPSLIKDLDKNLIDINQSQVFIDDKDIHREIFSYILLQKGKEIGKKPTYRVVTLDDLVAQHFTNDTLKPLCFSDILFIVHNTSYTGNPIFGTVSQKIIEERKMLNKLTYIFFRGSISKAKALGITENQNIVDYSSGIAPITHVLPYQTYSINKKDIQSKKPNKTVYRNKVAGSEQLGENIRTKMVDSDKFGGIL